MKKVLALGIIVLLLPLFTFAGNFPDFSKDKPKNISIGEFEINITEINSTINETGINTTINETEKPDDNSTIEPEEVKPTLTPEVKPNNTLSPINAFLTANITEPIEILEEQQILGIKRYAYASSKLVAEQRENEIIYYHQDRLSNRLITDQSGNVIRTSKYFPFGQEITSEINPGFAQKELDESNIQYFGGRYYDPNLGRFTSADPIKVENNFYVYSRNNPLTYHDPNGKRSEKIETAPEFHHIINTRHAWDRNQEIGARTRAGNGFHGAFDLLGQVQEHYWYQVEDNPIAQKIFEDGYSVYWAQRGYGELKEVMGEEYTRTGTEIYLDLKYTVSREEVLDYLHAGIETLEEYELFITYSRMENTGKGETPTLNGKELTGKDLRKYNELREEFFQDIEFKIIKETVPNSALFVAPPGIEHLQE